MGIIPVPPKEVAVRTQIIPDLSTHPPPLPFRNRGCLRGQAGVPPGLLERRVPHLLQYITAEERVAFEQREWSNAGGGFRANKLDAGGCVVLVGDAATSPPPPGQGVNHAFEGAAVLVEILRSGRSVASCVEEYTAHQMADEAAYAFMAAEKTALERALCSLGAKLGLHGRAGKETTARYSVRPRTPAAFPPTVRLVRFTRRWILGCGQAITRMHLHMRKAKAAIALVAIALVAAVLRRWLPRRRLGALAAELWRR